MVAKIAAANSRPMTDQAFMTGYSSKSMTCEGAARIAPTIPAALAAAGGNGGLQQQPNKLRASRVGNLKIDAEIP
jgi:hypothetical protein